MADDALFALIAAERRRLADELEQLSPADWEQPSLCSGWSTHVVAAHLNLPWSVSSPAFVLGILRARGNIDRAMDHFSRRQAERLDPACCIAGLRAQAEHRFTPPGFGPEAPLTDVVVHGADILRPLGRAVDPDPEALRTVLGFVTSPKGRKGFGAPNLDGVVLQATDVDVTVGAGDEVASGPALALVAAVLGRRAFTDQLAGDGVARLTAAG